MTTASVTWLYELTRRGGGAMVLISRMLAHGSIVDSISEVSYNQNRGGQILRAEEG
jgi:hypothetical protein